MAIFDFTHPVTGKTVSIEGNAPPDQTTIERIFSETGGTSQPSETSSPKEWAKMAGRGALETGAFLNRGVMAASNIVGRAAGVRPENNPVSKFLDQGDEEYGAMTKGYAPSQEADVIAGRLKPIKTPFTKDEAWTKEHSGQNFFMDQVEGAIPYVAGGALLAPFSAAALPVAAALSTHGRVTKKQMNQGVDSDTAMLKAAPEAGVEGALFGAMHLAKNAFMGTKALATDLGGKAMEGDFIPGKALDLLAKPLAKNFIVGDLEKGSTGMIQDVAREAAFVGPYLHAQGEAVQATGLAAGTQTGEEYQRAHGYDEKAGALDNMGNIALNQAKALGTSYLVGAGFGVSGALMKKAGNLSGEVRRDALAAGKDMQARWNQGKQEADAIETQRVADVVDGKQSLSILPDAKPVEELKRDEADNLKQSAIETSLQESHQANQEAVNTSVAWKNLTDDVRKQGDKVRLENYNPDHVETLLSQLDDAKISGLSEKQVSYAQDVLHNARMLHKSNGSSDDRIEPIMAKLEQHEIQLEDKKFASHPAIITSIEAVNKAGGILDSERGSIQVAPEYMVNAVKSIHAGVKNFVEFSKQLVAQFGEAIKQHAMKLWNYAKTLATSERGSFSTKDRIKNWKEKEKMLDEVTPHRSEDEDNAFHDQQFADQKKQDRTGEKNTLKDESAGYDEESKLHLPDPDAEDALDGMGERKFSPETEDKKEGRTFEDKQIYRQEHRFGKINSITGLTVEATKSITNPKKRIEITADVEKKIKVVNEDLLDKANRQLTNNSLLNKTDKAGGKSLRTMIMSDLDALSADYSIRDILTHVMKEEDVHSLSELKMYPTSLEEFISHVQDLKRNPEPVTAEDSVYSRTMPEDLKTPVMKFAEEIVDKFDAYVKTTADKKTASAVVQLSNRRNRPALVAIAKDPQKFIDVVENYLVQVERTTKGSGEKQIPAAEALKNPKDLAAIKQELIFEYSSKDPQKKDSFFITDSFLKYAINHMGKLRNQGENKEYSPLIEPHETQGVEERQKVIDNATKSNVSTGGKTPAEAKPYSREREAARIGSQYNQMKQEVDVNTGAHALALDFYTAIQKIAKSGTNNEAKLFDTATILKTMKENSKSGIHGVKDEEKQIKIIQKLLNNSQIRNGEFESMSNEHDSVDRNPFVPIPELKSLLESAKPEEAEAVQTIIDKLAKSSKMEDMRSEDAYSNLKEKNKELLDELRPLLTRVVGTKRWLEALKKVTDKRKPELAFFEDVTESYYSGVSENVDLNREKDQLGILAQAHEVDRKQSGRGSTPTINTTNDTVVRVKYMQQDFKEVTRLIPAKNLARLRETDPNMQILENIGKKESVENWIHLNTAKDLFALARDTGLIDPKSPESLETLELIHAVEYRNGGGKGKSINQALLSASMVGIRAKLAIRNLERTALLEKDFFEKQAKLYPEADMDAPEHYNEFLNAGGDKGIYQTRVIAQVEENVQAKADVLRNTIDKKTSPEAVRDLVTVSLSAEDRADYNNMMDGATEQRPTIPKDTYATGSNVARAVENTWDTAKRIRLTTLRDVERKILSLGMEKFEKETSVATEKANNQILPAKADIYSRKDFEKMTPFEKSLDVASVGRLPNIISQKFYELVSKAFGSDLVIVSDPDYRSRYIGRAEDGRSKLVINIDKSTSFARVYAHELFHHVVNKALPGEYQAFRKGVLATVDKTVWDKAILDLQRKEYRDYNVAEVADYWKTTINQTPRIYTTSQVGEGRSLSNVAHADTRRNTEVPVYDSKIGFSNPSELDTSNPLQSRFINKSEQKEVRHGNRPGEVPLEIRKAIEEELLAEVFSHAVTQKAFWLHLVGAGKKEVSDGNGGYKTVDASHGRVLAGKLATRLINRVSEVWSTVRERETGIRYEKDLLVKTEELDGIYSLVADIAGHSFQSNRSNPTFTNHGEIKYNTPLGDAKELYDGKIKPKISEAYKQVFPEGTISKKSVMTAMENFAKKIIAWVGKVKPEGMWADYMADPAQVTLASKLLHGHMFEVARAQKGVVDKFKDVWKGLSSKQLEDFHDAVVRANVDVSTPEGKQIALDAGMNEQQIETMVAYKEISDKLHGKLAELYPGLEQRIGHYGQSIKWYRKDNSSLDDAFDWMTKPDYSKLEGSKQWLKEKAENITTAEIMEKGMKYKTINPHDLFLDYVSDTNKLLQLKEMIDQGSKEGLIKIFSNQADAMKQGFFPINDNATKIFQKPNFGIGFKIKIGDEYFQRDGKDAEFTTHEDAAKAMATYATKDINAGRKVSVEEVKPTGQTDVTHFSVMEIGRIPLVDSKGKPLLDKSGAPTFEETKKEIRSFKDVKEANDYTEGLDSNEEKRYEVENVVSTPEDAVMARTYFKKDLARLVNVVLSEDKFRNGSLMGISGNKIMDLKNQMSSIEFAFSVFHAMTIGQEMTASTAAWNANRFKDQGLVGKLQGFNPAKAMKDSSDLSALMNAIIANEDLAKEPAVLAKANELLGTDSVDVLDVVKQFYAAGGMQGLDIGLQSSVHKLGDARYHEGERDVSIVDGEVVFGKQKLSAKVMVKSVTDAYEDAMAKDQSHLLAGWKTAKFAGLEMSSAWLMEQGIPKIKMAMWAREYTLKLDKNAEKLQAGLVTKEQLARDTMKFIEDRFGEVNWKNMWMNKTTKTYLQFLFRSFTWFTGSWKALGKAGIDVGKLGWFKIKGEKYELTEKGAWGATAILTHFMTAGLVSLAYQAVNGLLGNEEVEDDPETSRLTKMMFPRMDANDPTKRVAIPSYITELYKIMLHLGALGTEAEPAKLISGRFNSFLGNSFETFNNQDYQGVSIRNSNDSAAKQLFDSAYHVFAVAPIMASTVAKNWRVNGPNAAAIPTAILGFTDAPAAAKRSDATNKAFELRRKENKGKEVTEDQLDIKNEIKRAMYAYQKGDRSHVQELLANGTISKHQFDNALVTIPRIDGKVNPMYKNELFRAFKGLTIDGKLQTWEKMSDAEKKDHKGELKKTYFNMLARQDKSQNDKTRIKTKLKELGII